MDRVVSLEREVLEGGLLGEGGDVGSYTTKCSSTLCYDPVYRWSSISQSGEEQLLLAPLDVP